MESVSSKIHELGGSYIFFKYSKLNINWHKWIWKCCNKLPLLRREYLLLVVNWLSNSPKILNMTQRDFFNLISQKSINMVKVLLFSFEQSVGPITMLLWERSSKSWFFRHLSNHVFLSPEIQKYSSYEGHIFFWKGFKLNLTLENAKKKIRKYYWFQRQLHVKMLL